MAHLPEPLCASTDSSLSFSSLHLQYCIPKRLLHIHRLFLFRTNLLYILPPDKSWGILVLGSAWQPIYNEKHLLLLNMLLNRSTFVYQQLSFNLNNSSTSLCTIVQGLWLA